MNSKLRAALNNYKKAITDDGGTAWQQEESIAEAEKAIRQAVSEEMLELVDQTDGDLTTGIEKKNAYELRQKIKEWSQS